MLDIKTKVQGLDPNVRARDINDFVKGTDNIYETIAVIAKRAKQLNLELKQELHNKLDEFAVSNDAIEEISENKEQIEISKFYERLPNPVIIAIDEFLNGELSYRSSDKKRKKD